VKTGPDGEDRPRRWRPAPTACSPSGSSVPASIWSRSPPSGSWPIKPPPDRARRSRSGRTRWRRVSRWRPRRSSSHRLPLKSGLQVVVPWEISRAPMGAVPGAEPLVLPVEGRHVLGFGGNSSESRTILIFRSKELGCQFTGNRPRSCFLAEPRAPPPVAGASQAPRHPAGHRSNPRRAWACRSSAPGDGGSNPT